MVSSHKVNRVTDLIGKIQPHRRIEGISAILLPFDETGAIAYDELAAHVRRTVEAGAASRRQYGHWLCQPPNR